MLHKTAVRASESSSGKKLLIAQNFKLYSLYVRSENLCGTKLLLDADSIYNTKTIY